jgi:hypothetical protein
MPRFAAVASLAGALVSCSTRHACSRCVQAADCFHVRELHVVLWLTHWCLHLVRAASQLHTGSRSVHLQTGHRFACLALRLAAVASLARVCCSCSAQTADRSRRALVSCVQPAGRTAAVAVCVQQVALACVTHAVAVCRQGIAFACLALRLASVASARSCLGLVLAAGQQHTYWRALQAADRSHALACA